MGRHFVTTLEKNPIIKSKGQYEKWVKERLERAKELGMIFNKEANAKSFAKHMRLVTGVKCVVLPTELAKGIRKRSRS
jgi:hypothetical protein